MTLVVSWVGVDTHGTASAYIAADSRIVWSQGSRFDHARKVFAFRGSADVVGYCGDVLFPTMVLSQITEMADAGLLFPPESTCSERFNAIQAKFVQQFTRYPWGVSNVIDIMQIIHISRDPVDNLKFECRLIEWTRRRGWSEKDVPVPSTSGLLHVVGAGAEEFGSNLGRYKEGPARGTSRNVFHCFCDTLFNIKDVRCGGAPQLVGLYRKKRSNARTYGIIREGRRYFLGAEVGDDVDLANVEWRNELFELCDGYTMERLVQAQAQPDYLRRS